ncbi:hypothetical protein BHE74_00031248 [Ensete ventricosum]|nr:hypothetical protein GW17_00015590 [Ensete ventricosum]RWW61676.1 hypothetical protein BHE74_00031248 [Ensete ventricosum]
MASQCSLVKICSETQFDDGNPSKNFYVGLRLLMAAMLVLLQRGFQPHEGTKLMPRDSFNWYFSSLFHVLFLCFWSKYLNLLAQACIGSHYMQS